MKPNTSKAPFDLESALVFCPLLPYQTINCALTSLRRKWRIDPAPSPVVCSKVCGGQFDCRCPRYGPQTYTNLPHRISEVEFEVEFVCKFDFVKPKREENRRTKTLTLKMTRGQNALILVVWGGVPCLIMSLNLNWDVVYYS